jgi:hypothetical protein
MDYTVRLNDQQVELLRTIFSQIAPTEYVSLPAPPVRKLNKEEKAIKSMRELRANKAARKRN